LAGRRRRAVTPPRHCREDFFMAKDFCTYSINFLRQEKILRDHESDWRTEARLT
jgi:hypothetical protein